MVPHSNLLASIPTAFYFVFIVVFGNFFIMNLFIGVIISKYNREKELLGKDIVLSDS
jgi:hypothetical protein